MTLRLLIWLAGAFVLIASSRLSLARSASESLSSQLSLENSIFPLKQGMDDTSVSRVMSILEANIEQWGFIESQLLEPNVNLDMPEIFVPLRHLTTTLEVLGHILFMKNDMVQAKDTLERACPLLELLPRSLPEGQEGHKASTCFDLLRKVYQKIDGRHGHLHDDSFALGSESASSSSSSAARRQQVDEVSAAIDERLLLGLVGSLEKSGLLTSKTKKSFRDDLSSHLFTSSSPRKQGRVAGAGEENDHAVDDEEGDNSLLDDDWSEHEHEREHKHKNKQRNDSGVEEHLEARDASSTLPPPLSARPARQNKSKSTQGEEEEEDADAFGQYRLDIEQRLDELRSPFDHLRSSSAAAGAGAGIGSGTSAASARVAGFAESDFAHPTPHPMDKRDAEEEGEESLELNSKKRRHHKSIKESGKGVEGGDSPAQLEQVLVDGRFQGSLDQVKDPKKLLALIEQMEAQQMKAMSEPEREAARLLKENFLQNKLHMNPPQHQQLSGIVGTVGSGGGFGNGNGKGGAVGSGKSAPSPSPTYKNNNNAAKGAKQQSGRKRSPHGPDKYAISDVGSGSSAKSGSSSSETMKNPWENTGLSESMWDMLVRYVQDNDAGRREVLHEARQHYADLHVNIEEFDSPEVVSGLALADAYLAVMHKVTQDGFAFIRRELREYWGPQSEKGLAADLVMQEDFMGIFGELSPSEKARLMVLTAFDRALTTKPSQSSSPDMKKKRNQEIQKEAGLDIDDSSGTRKATSPPSSRSNIKLKKQFTTDEAASIKYAAKLKKSNSKLMFFLTLSFGSCMTALLYAFLMHVKRSQKKGQKSQPFTMLLEEFIDVQFNYWQGIFVIYLSIALDYACQVESVKKHLEKHGILELLLSLAAIPAKGSKSSEKAKKVSGKSKIRKSNKSSGAGSGSGKQNPAGLTSNTVPTTTDTPLSETKQAPIEGSPLDEADDDFDRDSSDSDSDSDAENSNATNVPDDILVPIGGLTQHEALTGFGSQEFILVSKEQQREEKLKKEAEIQAAQKEARDRENQRKMEIQKEKLRLMKEEREAKLREEAAAKASSSSSSSSSSSAAAAVAVAVAAAAAAAAAATTTSSSSSLASAAAAAMKKDAANTSNNQSSAKNGGYAEKKGPSPPTSARVKDVRANKAGAADSASGNDADQAARRARLEAAAAAASAASGAPEVTPTSAPASRQLKLAPFPSQSQSTELDSISSNHNYLDTPAPSEPPGLGTFNMNSPPLLGGLQSSPVFGGLDVAAAALQPLLEPLSVDSFSPSSREWQRPGGLGLGGLESLGGLYDIDSVTDEADEGGDSKEFFSFLGGSGRDSAQGLWGSLLSSLGGTTTPEPDRGTSILQGLNNQPESLFNDASASRSQTTLRFDPFTGAPLATQAPPQQFLPQPTFNTAQQYPYQNNNTINNSNNRISGDQRQEQDRRRGSGGYESQQRNLYVHPNQESNRKVATDYLAQSDPQHRDRERGLPAKEAFESISMRGPPARERAYPEDAPIASRGPPASEFEFSSTSRDRQSGPPAKPYQADGIRKETGSAAAAGGGGERPPGLQQLSGLDPSAFGGKKFSKPFPDMQIDSANRYPSGGSGSNTGGLSAGAVSFSPATTQLTSAPTSLNEPSTFNNGENNVTIVLLCHVEHMPSSNVASVKVTSPIPRSFNEAEFMMRRSTTNPRLWGVSVQIPRSSSFFEYKYIVSSSDTRPTIWKENRHPRNLSLLNIPQNQVRIELNDYFQNPVRSA